MEGALRQREVLDSQGLQTFVQEEQNPSLADPTSLTRPQPHRKLLGLDAFTFAPQGSQRLACRAAGVRQDGIPISSSQCVEVAEGAECCEGQVQRSQESLSGGQEEARRGFKVMSFSVELEMLCRAFNASFVSFAGGRDHKRQRAIAMLSSSSGKGLENKFLI